MVLDLRERSESWVVGTEGILLRPEGEMDERGGTREEVDLTSLVGRGMERDPEWKSGGCNPSTSDPR